MMANSKFRGAHYLLSESDAACACGVTKGGNAGNWIFFPESSTVIACCVGCGHEKGVRCRECSGALTVRKINHANQMRVACEDCGEWFGPTGHRRKRRSQRARHVQRQHLGLTASSMVDANASCVQCGSTENLEHEHRKPIAHGGVDALTNAQVMCRTCHNAKTLVEFGWVRS